MTTAGRRARVVAIDPAKGAANDPIIDLEFYPGEIGQS